MHGAPAHSSSRVGTCLLNSPPRSLASSALEARATNCWDSTQKSCRVGNGPGRGHDRGTTDTQLPSQQDPRTCKQKPVRHEEAWWQQHPAPRHSSCPSSHASPASCSSLAQRVRQGHAAATTEFGTGTGAPAAAPSANCVCNATGGHWTQKALCQKGAHLCGMKQGHEMEAHGGHTAAERGPRHASEH